MQLHRLTLEAIGPFAAEFSVDFASLSQSGIFLLEGPTGAGKSTIIDAIVFALYGEPASMASSKERLHSHHADPDTRPWVELVFETSSGIYRVHRTPQHVRPKQRGTGTTTENASARLVKITSPDDMDGGEVLSTSAAEVGGLMAGIIGLTREQFVQTVVLPQGEFAAFLRATGEQRREVLQSIFRTHLYDDITNRLIARRREAQASVRDARTAIETTMAGFVAVTSIDDATRSELSERDNLAALHATCSRIVEECHQSSAASASVLAIAQTRADEAAMQLAAQRELADRLTRRASLLTRQQALADREVEMAARHKRLELARSAVGVRSAIRGLAEADEALADSGAALESAKVSFGPGADAATVAGLAQRSDELTAERTTLAALIAKQRGMPSRQREVDDQTAEIQRLTTAVAAIDAASKERPAARKLLVDRLAGAQTLAGDRQISERALSDAGAALAAAGTVVALLKDESIARTKLQDLVTEVGTDQARVFSLRHQRLAGMAGELAIELTDGAACAVCGATEHPRPAVTAEDHPTSEQIDAAEQSLAQHDKSLGEARVKFAQLAAELDVARKASGGLDAKAALQIVSGARARVDAALAAEAEVENLSADIDSFDAAAAREVVTAQSHRVSIAALQASVTAQTAALVADAEEIAESHEGRADGLSALDAVLAEERSRCLSLRSALEVDDAATKARSSRLIERDRALADSGFGDATEGAAAAMDNAEIEILSEQLSTYDNQVAVVTESLADPAIGSLTGSEPTDVDGATENHRVCSEALDIASRTAHEAAGRAQSVAREFATVERALSANRTVLAEAAPLIRMADVADASGSANLRKLTLGSYVLVRRFEEVVKAANSRLGPMSNGRYQLERSDESESRGGRKTGLSLRIFDAWTGKLRDPRSASGGETFYASLSLALGLADVVMSEAGGTDLGTLFVDEGFGSLDSATLDTVMGELSKISSAGRVVGIVSHVEELKQRVSDRIAVRRNDDGTSRLTISSGNG